MKHLIRVLEFYWYLIHFNSKIWPMKYCFEGKNMTYEMVQNLARLDNQIKKSTFLPYLARVFGFNSNKKVFNCCNFLIHHPIVLHLFITLFCLWNSRFTLFFLNFFGFWYLFLRINQGLTKYGIDTCNMSIELFAQLLIFNLLYTLFEYFIVLSSD